MLRAAAGAAAIVTLSFAGLAHAATQLPTGFYDEPVASGLDLPVALAFLPDGRLLVAEQRSALVKLLAPAAPGLARRVGFVSGVNAAAYERGLLGLAVAPDFPAHPWVYVAFTASSGPRVKVVRYDLVGDLTWSGDGALEFDPASARVVIDALPDSQAIHNGGTLRFGPDGMLYVSIGDDAQPCRAQDAGSLHGAILRLDVSSVPAGPGAAPPLATLAPADNPFNLDPRPQARLVYAHGFRNPFRFHVDVTGAVLAGDVGEAGWEEIDWLPQGGGNFGWPWREALTPFESCAGSSGTGLVDPVAWYSHEEQNAAVISAGIVRGTGAAPAFPASYEGDYFYSDYAFGFVRRLHWDGLQWSRAAPVPGQPGPDDWGRGFEFVSDWLTGPDGSLWYVYQGFPNVPHAGQVRRIRAAATLAANDVPRSPRLDAIAPMPFRATTRIGFTIAAPASVTLTIHDPGGRRVRTLLAGAWTSPGRHSIEWDGRDQYGLEVGAGVYVVRLEGDGPTVSRRIVRVP